MYGQKKGFTLNSFRNSLIDSYLPENGFVLLTCSKLFDAYDGLRSRSLAKKWFHKLVTLLSKVASALFVLWSLSWTIVRSCGSLSAISTNILAEIMLWKLWDHLFITIFEKNYVESNLTHLVHQVFSHWIENESIHTDSSFWPLTTRSIFGYSNYIYYRFQINSYEFKSIQSDLHVYLSEWSKLMLKLNPCA